LEIRFDTPTKEVRNLKILDPKINEEEKSTKKEKKVKAPKDQKNWKQPSSLKRTLSGPLPK